MADFPIYRLVKGNTLTFTEMDDNLRWLSTNMSGSAVTITGSVIGMSGSVNIIGNVQIAGTASIGFIKSEGYSTGSNQLGDDTSDTQTLIGIVSVSGSMRVSGSTVINNLTGSLFGTSSWALNVTTASYALNAVTASFALTASYVSSNFQYEIHVSQVDGNDTTGNGSLLNPVASITKALTLTTTSRKTIIVHPGTYSENITIGATNTTIATSELTGANTLLSGTLTIGTSGSGSRISGLKMTNLVISGIAQAYISNCTVDNQVTKSSSGYVEIINSEMQCTLGIQISGAGTTIINGNKNVAVAVSNASAQVIIKGCNSVVTPSASAGNLAIVDSIVTALGGNAITITGASTGLTLANSQVLVQAGNNVAPISVAGIYSIFNTVYDKPNSTLSGTSTNSIDYFQYINADNITIGNGLTVTGSLNVTGQTTAAGFTGSLFGTSSWARNVTTASYALNAVSASFASTASYVNPLNQQVIITGSLIQGLGNIATGEKSHAEGDSTQAIGNFSHAEGLGTIAYGGHSHAEGQDTIASGSYSHAEGNQTIALANHQHVQGQYNITSSAPAAFIIGNGTDDGNRSNLIHAAGNEVQITGSLKVLGSITGSLFGTASNAVSSSYALSASYAVSSSYAYTASSAISASLSISSSYVSGSAAIVTNLTSSNDALINGIPIGKGLGSVATNIAIGQGALANFVAGTNSNNTAIGNNAMFSASSGNYNTAVGSGALVRNGTGFQNTAIGSFAMFTNGSGSYNTAVGYSAMQLSTGSFNTAIGNLAMPQNTGSNNTVIGYQAMLNARSSVDNVSIGQNSLGTARNANYNVSIGSLSLYNASGTGFGTSSYNIAIGYEAARRTQGAFLYSASYGIFIGTDVRPLQDVSNNEIVIGYQAIGSGSNTVSIGNSSITITQLQGSVRTTGAFTGSLFGTSSWSENTISSSYAYTASSAVNSSNALTLNQTSSNGFVSNMSDTYTGTAKITDIITLSSAEYAAIGAPLTSTLYIII